MAESFVKLRRGILEHLQQTRLNCRQFAVFQLIVLLADKSTGVWWGDSVGIMAYLRDLGSETAKRLLHELEEKGYIKRFRQQGSRSSYPILVNKYEITVGGLKGRRILAEQTVDWLQPATETLTEEPTEMSTEVTTGVWTGVPPPYTRPQDHETSRPQENKSSEGQTASPRVSPESETPEPTPDDIKPQPPADWKSKYERPEDVPREEQAFYLTCQLFACLGSPKNHLKKLPEWERQLKPLCDQFEFPEMYAVIKWATHEDLFWSGVIKRAENFVKNAEKIMDAYRAHLRGKTTYVRSQKQAQEQDPRKKAPANYGRGQIKLEGSYEL